MTPTTSTTDRRRLLVTVTTLLILFVAAVSVAGCHRHISLTEAPGADGQDGTDGLGFDFVADIGGELASDYWIGDAALVLPPEILAVAPTEATLFLGNDEEFHRYYLRAVSAGTYCVIDRDEYEILGQLDFYEDGYLALVELTTLEALGLLALVSDGVAVELDEPATITSKKKELRIGSVRIRLYGGKD